MVPAKAIILYYSCIPLINKFSHMFAYLVLAVISLRCKLSFSSSKIPKCVRSITLLHSHLLVVTSASCNIVYSVILSLHTFLVISMANPRLSFALGTYPSSRFVCRLHSLFAGGNLRAIIICSLKC